MTTCNPCTVKLVRKRQKGHTHFSKLAAVTHSIFIVGYFGNIVFHFAWCIELEGMDWAWMHIDTQGCSDWLFPYEYTMQVIFVTSAFAKLCFISPVLQYNKRELTVVLSSADLPTRNEAIVYFRCFKRKTLSLISDWALEDECYFESPGKKWNYETYAGGIFFPEMRLLKVLSSTPGSKWLLD